MSQSAVISIRQLTNRLENATSSERLNSLQELQIIARSEPKLVGEYSLQSVLDFLKEQGSPEEYQECLDLIDRLIKTRDKSAAIANTGIVLSAAGNVELLLDLLEHGDLTVGVMTSQILTEVHAIDAQKLEECIQKCPAGMTKLLHRLTDRSREEVSNQAIVLVQQLTSRNEEMKKTVVFNEGFEILFGIIQSEGGSTDAGIVVQDCLQICCNMLQNSDICQRFFFGMGAKWAVTLLQFFSPLVENLRSKSDLTAEGEGAWFEHVTRVGCALLALKSLCGALEVANKKHQALIALKTDVVCAAAFWVARKGPELIVEAALVLLSCILEGNADVAKQVAEMVVEVPPPISGKTHPMGVEAPAVYFGWRPLPSDDRRLITVPALLAERFVYSSAAWSSIPLTSTPSPSPSAICTFNDKSMSLSMQCVHVLETLLRADESVCDLMIQYILAPPPPSGDDDSNQNQAPLESMRPLGTILFNTLIEGSHRILTGADLNLPEIMINQEIAVIERCANVLALLFINGGRVSSELCTVISTSHLSPAGFSGAVPPQPLLPLLLAVAGRALKVPFGEGVFVSLMRLLSAIVSGCNVAARQIFEDPSNFFILDLAGPSSDPIGIPITVQVSVCLFLGASFTALEDSPVFTHKEEEPGPADFSRLRRESFLGMIETRIGLPRFNDLLKKPLSTDRGGCIGISPNFFFTQGFKEFYKGEVEAVRENMFSLYSGAGADVQDTALLQILAMQKEKIAELEGILSSSGITISDTRTADDSDDRISDEQVSDRGTRNVENDSQENLLSVRILELESLLEDSDTEVITLQNMMMEIEKERDEMSEKIKLSANKMDNDDSFGRGNIMGNSFGNLSTKSDESQSPEDSTDLDLHMSRIYPNSDQTLFGGTNPLSPSPDSKYVAREIDRDSGSNNGWNSGEANVLKDEVKRLRDRAETAEKTLALYVPYSPSSLSAIHDGISHDDSKDLDLDGEVPVSYEQVISTLREHVHRLDSERLRLLGCLEVKEGRILLLTDAAASHQREERKPIPAIMESNHINTETKEIREANIRLMEEVRNLNKLISTFQEEKIDLNEELQILQRNLKLSDEEKCEMVSEKQRIESLHAEMENRTAELQDEILFLKSQQSQFHSEEKSKLNAFKILNSENIKSLELQIEKLKSERDEKKIENGENDFDSNKEQYLLKRLILLENELKDYTEAASMSKTEIENSNLMISNLQNKIDDMIVTNDEKDKERAVKEDYLLKRTLNMEKELISAIDENCLLSQDIENSKILMQTNNQLNSSLIDEKSELLEASDDNLSSLIEMTELKENLQSLLDSSVVEIDLLKAMSLKLLNEKVEELQRTEEEKKNIISTYNNKRESQLELLNDQITELRSENTEIASLRDQIIFDKRELLSLKDQVTELKSQNTEIAKLKDQLRFENAEIASLKDQINSADTEVSMLKNQITDLKLKSVGNSALKNQIKSENSEMAALKDEITILKANNAEVVSLRAKIAFLTGKLQVGEDRIQVLQSEAENHAGEMEDTTHEIESLTSLLEEFTTEKVSKVAANGQSNDIRLATLPSPHGTAEEEEKEEKEEERERENIAAKAATEAELRSLRQLLEEKNIEIENLSLRLDDEKSEIRQLKSESMVESEERNRIAADKDAVLAVSESITAAAAATLTANENMLAAATSELNALKIILLERNTEIDELQLLFSSPDNTNIVKTLPDAGNDDVVKERDVENDELKILLGQKDKKIEELRHIISSAENQEGSIVTNEVESGSGSNMESTVRAPDTEYRTGKIAAAKESGSNIHHGDYPKTDRIGESDGNAETELSLMVISLNAKIGEVEELQYSVDDKIAEIEQLTIFLNSKDIEIGRLSVIVDDTQKEIEQLKSVASTKSAAESLSITELEKLKLSYAENLLVIDTLKLQLSAADGSLSSEKGRLLEKEAEVEKLRISLADSCTETEDLKSQLITALAEVGQLKLSLADIIQCQATVILDIPEPVLDPLSSDIIPESEVALMDIIEELKSTLLSKNNEEEILKTELSSRVSEIRNLQKLLDDHIRENDEVELLFNKKIIENDDLKSSLLAMKVRLEQGIEEEKHSFQIERESQKEKDEEREMEREVLRKEQITKDIAWQQERETERTSELEKADETRRELEVTTDRLMTAVAQADMLRTQLLQVQADSNTEIDQLLIEKEELYLRLKSMEQSRMKEREQKEILQKQLRGLDQNTNIGIDGDRSINAITPSSQPQNTFTEMHTSVPVSQGTVEHVSQNNVSLLLELEQMKAACTSLKELYEGLKLERDAFEDRLAHANAELEEVSNKRQKEFILKEVELELLTVSHSATTDSLENVISTFHQDNMELVAERGEQLDQLEKLKRQILGLETEVQGLLTTTNMTGDVDDRILAQQSEILRLSVLAEHLQREIDEKDLELRDMAAILDIKETEKSTMNMILLNLRDEIEHVREENEEITRHSEIVGEKHELQLALCMEQQKEEEKVRDKDRLSTKDTEDQTEKVSLKERPVLFSISSQSSEHTFDSIPQKDFGCNSESKAFHKIERALSEILLWLESKRIFVTKIVPPISCYSSPDCSVFGDDLLNGGRRHSVGSAANENIDINSIEQVLQLIERTRCTTELVIDEREHEIVRQTSLVKVNELLLEQAKLQLMLEGKDGSGTSGAQSPIQTPMGPLPSSLSTPARMTGAGALVASISSSGTPHARETARLHVEVNRERRKLQDLQEQHADLLSLLAQQEVELGVFRSAIHRQGGEPAVEKANELSQIVAIRKYGTYTNFRQILEWNLEESGRYTKSNTSRSTSTSYF